MISVEEAIKIILKEIKPSLQEAVPLLEALDRVIFEDTKSHIDIPGFDNSAMDGFAVKDTDTKSATNQAPRSLKLIEQIKAGSLAKKSIRKGETIKIMTGAPLPQGANAVVMVEDSEILADEKGSQPLVKIKREVILEENIRKVGENIRKGETVIPKGTRLKEAHLGLLASLGIKKVKVFRKPRFAILSTGDELIELGKKLTPGKLYSSNVYAIWAQLTKCGAHPFDLGIARDNFPDLKAKIIECLKYDAIVTSGGVSAGDYDLVIPMLKELKADIKFWKIGERPSRS